MTEELKPCPFCGGEAVLDRDGYWREDGWKETEYYVACVKCLPGVKVFYNEHKKDTVKCWNRRGGI